MKPTRALRCYLLLSSSALLTISWTQAQTIYDWQTSAPDGNWKRGINNGPRWNPGGLWDEPVSGSGVVLRFNNDHELNMTNNVGGTYYIHGLIFGSGNSSTRTINDGTIRFQDWNLGSSDPYISNDSTATHIINSALEGDGDAGDPLWISLNNSGGLTFGGTINNQGSNINVGGSTGSATTVSLNGVVSGSGGLYLNNSNITLSLGAAHTFTGQTTVDAGTLLIASGGNLASSDVRLASGTLLQVNSSAEVASIAERGTDNSGTVNIASGATLTINGADKGTLFQNTISGDGNLVMAGSGTTSLALFGTQSWTGSTTVSGGKISTGVALATSSLAISGGTFETSAANILGDTVAVTLSSGTYALGGSDTIGSLAGSGGTLNLGSHTLTTGGNNSSTAFSGTVSGSGGSILKTGSGTLTLSAANTYSGGTILSAGTLRATTDADALGTGDLTLSGGILELAGDTGLNFGNNTTVTADTTISTQRLTAGAGVTHSLGTLSIGAQTLTVTSAVANSGTQGLTFGATTLTGDAIFDVINGSTATNLTLGAVGGTGYSLTKSGNGTLTLGSGSTYTGATTISQGVLNIQNATALGTTAAGTSVTSGAALEMQGGITVGAEALSLNGTGISNNGALRNISGNNTWGGLITLGSAARINSDADLLTLDVASGNAITGTQNLTFGGAGNITVADIIATGTGTLTKDGAGILTLGAANTYTGLTTVSGGELRWGLASALSSGALTVSGGTVNMQTFNDTVGAVTLTGGTISGSTGVLTGTSYAVESGTISAILGGTGAMNKTTAGTVILSGNNTFNGGITLTAGTLKANGGNISGNLGAGTLALNGGTLDLATTHTSGINYARNTTVGGNAKIITQRDSAGAGLAYTLGTLGIGANTLTVEGGNVDSGTAGLTFGTTTFSGDTIFDITNPTAGGITQLTLGSLSQTLGAKTITKQGNGTLLLGTAANALFTGSQINVTGGVLIANVQGSLSSVATTANNTTVNVSGTGELRGTTTGVFRSNGTGNPSQLINLSAGTLTLANTGNITYGGNLVYTGGTVTLDRTALGNAQTATMGSLSIGASTLAPTQVNYNAAPTLAFGSTSITGNALLDSSNVKFTLGTLAIGASTLTTQGSNTLTATGTTISGASVFSVGSTAPLTLGALTQSGGSQSLTKRGAGNLTLSGASDLAGGLIIEAGAVRLGAQTAAGAGTVTLGVTGNATSGTLDLNGGSRDIVALTTAGDATLQIIGNSSTASNNVATLNYIGSGSSTFGGVIQNTVLSGNKLTALTVNNATGSLTLSGTAASTYTGLTTVTAGTLVLNKSGSVAAMGGNLTINGGMVQYNALAGSNQIGNSAIVTVAGGTFDMNGVSDTVGSLVYQSGTVSTSAGLLTLANNTATALSMQSGTIGSDLALSNTTTTNVGVTFDATNNGTATISSGLNINSSATTGVTRTFTINDGSAAIDMDISGAISNTTSTGLAKIGLGTLQFSGSDSNTYGGLTTVSAGTLLLNKSDSAQAIAGGGLSVVGATVQYTATAGGNQIADTAAVTLANGAGVATLDLNGKSDTIGSLTIGGASGAATSQGAVTTGAGTLTLGGGVTYTATGNPLGASISGKLDLGLATRTFTINDSTGAATDLDVSAAISGTGVGLTKSGTGTLLLSGSAANTFNGLTTVSTGELQLGKTGVNAIGGDLTVSGGTAKLTGTGGDQIGNSRNLFVSSGTFDLNGLNETVNGVQMTGGTIQGGVGILTSTTAFDMQAGSVSAILGGSAGLTKTTSGTLTLTGANTYTGTTAVNAGTLLVNGSLASGSAVTVASGATLGGNGGTIGGTVNIAAGGILSPGSSFGTIGTLNLTDASPSALTLNGGNTRLLYDLPTSGASDQIAITGDLVLNETNTVWLNTPAAGIAASTNFDLMTYANKTGSGSLVFVNGLTTMGSLTLVTNATTNAQLQVGAGGLNNSVWKGTSSGVWDTSATNWTRNTVATQAYADGDFVTFDNTATAYTVTGGTLNPALVTVNGGTPYVISAKISGTTALVKNGTGKLNLTGANDYSGGTIINGASTFDDVNASSFGTGTITVAANTTFNSVYGAHPVLANALQVNAGTTFTGVSSTQYYSLGFSGVVSGDGTIAVPTSSNNGSPGYKLLLSNSANTFTGTLQIGGIGNLRVHSMADSSNPIKMGGASFEFHGDNTNATSLSFANRPFELAASASILNNNSSSSKTITIGSDLAYSGTGTRTLTLGGGNGGANVFAGDIANNGGSAVGITKDGGGTWTLSGTNTYSGTTTVSGGTLVFQGEQALPSASAISITGSSTTKFLDDGAGVVTFGNSITQNLQNFTTTLFVGNNSTTNGGNSSGTTTGSTIALGAFTFYDNTDVYTRTLSVTGANSYRLQLSDVTLHTQGGNLIGGGRDVGIISPTTAPITITGTVIQKNGKGVFDSGRRAYLDYLQLDGTATGNLISGTIMDAADYTNSFNPNAVPLGVIKRNSTGQWSLTGANTYTGRTQIDQGILTVNSLANAGVASPLGQSTSAAGLVLNGGTLQYAPVNASGGAGHSTNRNFALVASSTIDASGTGALLFNAPSGNIVSPDITGLTGTTTAGSAIITGLSSTANLAVGMGISMTGVPAGRTIASIDSATQITLNNATSVTAGTNAASFGTNNARTLTLTGTNTDANTIAGILQDSSAAGTGVLSLSKSGVGRWVLSGTNTYTGSTAINAGVLEAVDGTGLPTASILQLRGGVFQSNGTFNRDISTAAGDVNWATSSGGFAARGGNLTLNLNGGTGSVTWNGSSMVSTGQTLIFGSTSADSLVDFQNALNLGSSGSGQRTIQVIDNPDSMTDRARISGNITNTAAGWGIIKTGDSTLELTGTNTYTGATTVNGGTLVVGVDNVGSITSNVTVNDGGTLGGSGTITGDVTVNDGGTHAVGNSPGLQTINGQTTYNSGSIFAWDLAANLNGSSLTQTWDHDNNVNTAEIAARGSAYDAVNINGSLTVQSGAIFRVIQNEGVDFSTAFWTQNQQWSNIFSVTGSLSGWAADTAVAVYNLANTNITGSIAQYGSFTISGATLSWQAVPEPTTALAGLLLTAGLLRRRRK